MTEKRLDWLVREINDLLDVSSVGLYEFMRFLDDPEDPIPVEQRLTIARRALERILAQDGVELYWMQWPEFDHRGTVSVADLPSNLFCVPDERGRYIAADRECRRS